MMTCTQIMFTTPGLVIVLIAVASATLAISIVVSARRAEARAELKGRRDLAVLALLVDDLYGTEQRPNPGSAALYSLHPDFVVPQGIEDVREQPPQSISDAANRHRKDIP